MKHLQEEFYAVFDNKRVSRHDSFELARNAAVAYVLKAYITHGTKNTCGQNWAQHFEVFDLAGKATGFGNSKWTTGAHWGSATNYFPDRIYFDLIDPRGIVRQLHTEPANISASNTVYLISKALTQVSKFDSWEAYDLTHENLQLKERIAKLTEENKRLKALLA
ncbi:hypothetical protein F0P96_18515 [Hymenobacter busanensis]|uniref:Uncharacterized protein n=1 Tax=Hymenobacter busanensis TaxID=2607656 RepID=A0A7L4ZSM7_9BACT|nr:hypothetical protein [Hymenobacter busanensis]KAA9327227.1 hypothetical protein F0P96_18515 [Hymenobacter busanensis]QHJ05893.1 hypothetical protein GUY19_00720 [Hymenobacter busanensis]